MGQAVVHFEVVGKDGDKLQSYYADLFGWDINSDNPMNYGMVDAKDNKTADGNGGIGGGVGQALQKAESLGGKRVMGPEDIMGMVVLGQFTDPEGNLVGVVNDQSPEG